MATNFSIKNRDRLRKPSKLPLELFFSLPVAVCPPIISANVTLFMRIKKEIQSISFTEKKTNHRRSTPHNNSNHSTELCFCRDCFCAICLIDNKLLFSGTTATQSAITIVAYYLLLHYSWSTSTNFEWIHFDITLIPFPLIVTIILIAPPPSRAAYSNRWRWMKTFRQRCGNLVRHHGDDAFLSKRPWQSKWRAGRALKMAQSWHAWQQQEQQKNNCRKNMQINKRRKYHAHRIHTERR